MNFSMIRRLIIEILEGTGDKYLENKHGIKPEFDDFDKKFRSAKRDRSSVVFEKEDGWKLLKNPNSLTNISASARGVIMNTGDLYIESESGLYIHNDILEILYNLNILKLLPKKNWTRKLPNESGFLTVQRYKNSDFIAIGESNKLLYDEESWMSLKDEYDEYLNRARAKNPNINFINKIVGVKYLKTGGTKNMMDESYLNN